MRRRAASGEDGTRGWFLFFSLEVAPVSEVCVDHRSGHAAPCRLRRDGTRGWFLFFLWRLLRCRGGDCFTPAELGNDIELFHPRRRAVSCEAALRILSNGESCPPCGGDSGYFPSACAK